MPRKIVIGKNGVVVNVVGPAPELDPNREIEWVVDDATVIGTGETFDPKDPQIDNVDVAVFRVLHRHENLLRQLIRAVRGAGAAANTSCNNESVPSTAASPDLTLTQSRSAFKSLIP